MAAVDGSTSPSHVHFDDDITVNKDTRRRVELTQRYDREAVQRRLDIESWMDDQLKILYDCEV